MKQETKIEVLYKPYSSGIRGYILRIADLIYFVINSRLSKKETEKTQKALSELSASNPQDKLVLLRGDGTVQKTNNLEFLERAC